MSVKINRLGKKYGMLTVVSLADKTDSRNRPFWNCVCECGGKSVVCGDSLSQSESCGCVQKERASAASKTHGKSNIPEYRIWGAMLGRCLNPRDKKYKDYGGRGIVVCDRWKDFALFYEDMGTRPSDVLSIERKNVNGNYEPSNCKWGTDLEQANNTRRNHFLIHDGIRQTIQQWSRTTGLSSRLIWIRINRGWNTAKALTVPALTSRYDSRNQPA